MQNYLIHILCETHLVNQEYVISHFGCFNLVDVISVNTLRLQTGLWVKLMYLCSLKHSDKTLEHYFLENINLYCPKRNTKHDPRQIKSLQCILKVRAFQGGFHRVNFAILRCQTLRYVPKIKQSIQTNEGMIEQTKPANQRRNE